MRWGEMGVVGLPCGVRYRQRHRTSHRLATGAHVMARYASNTEVTSSKSRDEIERTLSRYGATGFMYGWDQNRAVLAFQAHGRRVQFMLPMPDRDAREFTHTPKRNQRRSQSAASDAYEQAVRQRWRALALVVKAKLEAVESEITTFDEEFMAHIVLPSGATVGQWMTPQIADAYETGAMPQLLPGASAAALPEGTGR